MTVITPAEAARAAQLIARWRSSTARDVDTQNDCNDALCAVVEAFGDDCAVVALCIALADYVTQYAGEPSEMLLAIMILTAEFAEISQRHTQH